MCIKDTLYYKRVGKGLKIIFTFLEQNCFETCIIYYGMPVQDVNLLRQLVAPVLGIFGEKDNYINPEVVQQFEDNMEKANQPLTVKMYDADHAFANPTSDRYNKKAAREAYQITIDFLQQHL